MTTPERWQRIKELLAPALELDSAGRAIYLDQACRNDPTLRPDLERLLAAERRAGPDFLSGPVILEELGHELESDPDAWVGRRLGAYQIVEEISAGGMGEVYRAVRADDEYRKEVAIKLVRSGQDSGFVLSRFKNERQILASFEHPNIARLLDGGTTEEGLPYFVMELIDGQRLDEYCEAQKLATNERLGLFLQVCSAVQYAHQRLVIHRDIKPGNIIVNAEGVPKLLDFGIAKILETAENSPQQDQTISLFRLLTPLYASPEQVKGEPITTASDVYSLGVVLYELLTGRTPYNVPTHTPHEVSRAVCETEPEKPSAAVRRTQSSPSVGREAALQERTALGGVREGSPAKLSKRLRGDLDNIVLMALRKEPQRRYASVEQLAQDIRRHLEHLPVVALKDTVGYRASKFVARHKLGVAAVSLLVLSLAGGLTATLWQARIARANQLRAEKRFNDVRKLANSLVFEVHDAIRDLAGATPARKLLVAKGLEYLDGLAQESRDDPSLQRELATAYQKLGDVQGYMGRSNLGDTAGALQSYGKALALREALRTAHPKDRLALSDLGISYMRLGQIRMRMGDFDRSLESWRRSLDVEQDLVESDPTNLEARAYLAESYDGMGDVFVEMNNLSEVKKNYEHELAIFEALRAADPVSARARRNLSVAYKKVGGVSEATGNIPEALDRYREAMAIDEALSAANPTNALMRRDLSISDTSIGDVLARMGRLSEAADYYKRALAIDEALAAADPNDANSSKYLRSTCEKIGNISLKNGQTTSALSNFRRALAAAEAESIADQADMRSRSDMAAFSSRIAEAYGTMAAQAAPDRRQEYWRQARSWYQKSLSIWQELRQRRSVASREDAESPETANQGIAKCDAALAKLKAHRPR